MKRPGRSVLWVIAALLLTLLVGPFLIPIPPLTGTVPPEELADADSLFVDITGLRTHYKVAGHGEPVLVLLHGFSSSVFSWREVMEPLAKMGTVIAFDRPPYGLTQRPLRGEWTGTNPYSSDGQVEQTMGLLDQLQVEKAILIGNSAGGSISMLAALRHPERVQALVLVDAAVYVGGPPSWLRPLLRFPQLRRLGPLLVRLLPRFGDRLLRSAWHDPEKITPEVIEGYRKPLQAANWDRALWESNLASEPLRLEEQLDRFRMPTLVITGDDDRWVPTEQSIRLASELPNAKLVVVPNCGHLPQEECPDAFLEAVTAFLAALP